MCLSGGSRNSLCPEPSSATIPTLSPTVLLLWIDKSEHRRRALDHDSGCQGPGSSPACQYVCHGRRSRWLAWLSCQNAKSGEAPSWTSEAVDKHEECVLLFKNKECVLISKGVTSVGKAAQIRVCGGRRARARGHGPAEHQRGLRHRSWIMHDPLEVRGWPSLLFKGKESYNVRRAGSMNHILHPNCSEYEF
jgi:hypothetical protein